jgi:hypothetical protein
MTRAFAVHSPSGFHYGERSTVARRIDVHFVADVVLRPVVRSRHFKYGVDYFSAYTRAELNLQQNVTLPGGQVPQIQQSSLVGEVYRYQVVGPPHFGLTNLRTVQEPHAQSDEDCLR